MKKLSLALTMLALAINITNAASLDPTKVGLGARMIAMGRTAAAAPGDVNSIFVNPANAAYLPELGITSMYTNLSEDIAYTFLGGAKPFPLGRFGLAYLGATSGGFQQTTVESGRVVGTGSSFDYSSSVICLTYGREIRENLALGTNLKLFNKGFGNVSGGTGSGFDADLGLLWLPRPKMTVGLSMQNALPSSIAAIKWGTDTKEDIPLNLKMGINFVPKNDLLLAADLDYAANNPMTFHGGVEWKPKEWLAVRGGFDQLAASASQANTNYTAGVGFGFKGFNFDYAYYHDTLLASNAAHYFSLSYLFPPAAAKPAPAPKPEVIIEKPLPKPGLIVPPKPKAKPKPKIKKVQPKPKKALPPRPKLKRPIDRK